ncbi:MAG TPA: hypothetical protein VMJ49_00435, partial [Gaiellaceae bacterium]|nr:hypothetical protein [Gaiellaceae bacterium]
AGTGKKKIVKLTLSDPVWSVTVSERGVVVGVTTGFVQVAAAAGSPTPVVVGPGTQTVAGPNGIPTPTTQFLAPPEVQASLKSLQSFAPTYPFARPVPGSSPTLQRVTTANVVRIGYDRTAATSQVLAFLKSFASFLGTSWNVKPQLTAVTASSAPKLLASGKVDFVAETSETGTLFLSPTAGAPWRLVTNQDSGADAAAAAFVSDVLNSGKYLTLFQGSFKTVPSYTSFGSVFFK